MESVVVVAHGTVEDRPGKRTATTIAETLRNRTAFETVQAAFLHGSPSIEETLTDVRGRLVVVPLFFAPGHLAGTVVPRRVEEAVQSSSRVSIAEPVGTHPMIADIVLRRVRDVSDESGDDSSTAPTESVGLALLAHGSRHTDAHRATVRRHAARIEATGAFSAVEDFYLETDPGIEAARTAFDADVVVGVPLFFGTGRHVTRDVPDRFADGDRSAETAADVDSTFVYADPIGTDPLMTRIVLDRARGEVPPGRRSGTGVVSSPVVGATEGPDVRGRSS